MPIESYLRVAEAAQELGVTSQQVRHLIRQGRLRAERINPRLYLVERASVEHYKRSRQPPGRPRRFQASCVASAEEGSVGRRR